MAGKFAYKAGHSWGRFKRNLVKKGIEYGYTSGKNTSSKNQLPQPKIKRMR